MTYSEAFPLWVAEVYRNHGYEPDKWYGSEVAEMLYNEAMATYNGPPATMRDYIEAIPSAEEFAVIQLFSGGPTNSQAQKSIKEVSYVEST